MGTYVRCISGADTVGEHPRTYTTRNHQGSEVGVQGIAIRWLVTVPRTRTYKCTLMGFSNRTPPEEDTLKIVPGTNTALIMEDAPVPGAEQWFTPDTVIQVGASPYVLRKVWTAPPGATTIDLDGDAEVTTNGQYSTVTTNLYSTQLKADNSGCAPAVVVQKIKTIYQEVHHWKFHNSLRDVPISTAPSCTRKFAFKVRVGVSAGSSVKVEGESPTHPCCRYSNAIVIPRP